ncbi:hypothetical protein FORC72_3345 [Vibrio parahaemolyticus]|nr:hypothetical protein FORC72_3345 [Vibrio parahaemolyticus]ETZ11607.1 hypothetical protein AJ90_23430 [Vibrio parahaemolyticus M0605]
MNLREVGDGLVTMPPQDDKLKTGNAGFQK